MIVEGLRSYLPSSHVSSPSHNPQSPSLRQPHPPRQHENTHSPHFPTPFLLAQLSLPSCVSHDLDVTDDASNAPVHVSFPPTPPSTFGQASYARQLFRGVVVTEVERVVWRCMLVRGRVNCFLGRSFV